MKKIIVLIIIAAVLGVGGGIVATRMNKPVSADINRSVPEVKTGNYYFNGDKNTGLWVEVYSDYLTLNGDDVDASIKAAIIKLYEENGDTPTGEGFQKTLEDTKQLYCGKKLYAVQYVGLDNWPYAICVSRDNTETTREELLNSNAAFNYNGKDTIYLGAFGDFILVD